MLLTFEWDEDKADQNLKKHDVSFHEAKTVFNDPFAITIHDPDHSDDEDRYIDIGLSFKGRLIVVLYTERGNTIRIISSRRATKREQRDYEER
ncbi:MAG: BrnT family toxin [Planctomycetota bacterium]|nr:MAG: BrnT family toxin [Planctomycetota bacterium]